MAEQIAPFQIHGFKDWLQIIQITLIAIYSLSRVTVHLYRIQSSFVNLHEESPRL